MVGVDKGAVHRGDPLVQRHCLDVDRVAVGAHDHEVVTSGEICAHHRIDGGFELGLCQHLAHDRRPGDARATHGSEVVDTHRYPGLVHAHLTEASGSGLNEGTRTVFWPNVEHHHELPGRGMHVPGLGIEAGRRVEHRSAVVFGRGLPDPGPYYIDEVGEPADDHRLGGCDPRSCCHCHHLGMELGRVGLVMRKGRLGGIEDQVAAGGSPTPPLLCGQADPVVQIGLDQLPIGRTMSPSTSNRVSLDDQGPKSSTKHGHTLLHPNVRAPPASCRGCLSLSLRCER